MPTAGLSLFAFYSEDVAAQYLVNACHMADQSPAALGAAWTAANERLGPHPANAGSPAIADLPPACADHVAKLQIHPLFSRFQQDFGVCEVKLVEIRPIIAAQVHVERNRCSGMHDLSGATADQLIERCLPLQDQGLQVNWEPDPSGRGLLIRHADFNVQTMGGTGTLTPEGALVVGAILGLRALWVHTITIDGRVYLRNGYHRAVGLLEAGQTHMPCLMFSGHRGQLGVNNFPLEVIHGEHPPTLGHFDAALATEVQLRKQTKMIAISWSEFLVPDRD